MGGRVEVDSTEGQGATFTIFLPANGDPSAGS
jgi:signal transduction histidine kinase